MPCKIIVVIPYYQRDPGILRRALVSVGRQNVGADLGVIIVDDASPLPPDGEIAAADLRSDIPVQVVRAPNGGPGAARNIGIDQALADGADYIAFLDSDDEWLPGHLNDAIRALSSGASFYFCDNRRVDAGIIDGAVSFEANWPCRREVAAITPLGSGDDLYEMPQLTAFDEFLKAYLGQTSTVVYRASVHAHARFAAELRSAGEDHMMWLQMTRESTGVCFSTKANVLCGRGVNIYFSALDWSLPATRNRLGYLSLFYSLVIRRFPLSGLQEKLVRAKRDATLSMFGYLAARQAAKGRLPPLALIRNLLSTAPRTVFDLPILTLRTVAMRADERSAWADSL